MTSSLAPLSALTAMEDGLVDAVLSEGNQDFLLALQDNTHNLLCDEARMQELLAAKAAANRSVLDRVMCVCLWLMLLRCVLSARMDLRQCIERACTKAS